MSKIKKIQDILHRENVDAWMFVNDEGKDPYFSNFISPNTSAITVAIITKEDLYVFVSSLEKEIVEHHVEKAKIKVFTRKEGNTLDELLIEFYREHKELKVIALNYSTMNNASTDIIGHGFFEYYTKLLINNVSHIMQQTFVSAEKIIYAMIDSKSLEEIKKMEITAIRARNILEIAFKNIKVGMTELELIDVVHGITESTREEFIKSYEGFVKEEEYSWEEECCPIVLTGQSFKKGGHALSTDTIIEKGNTVYFDFGICLTFNDGTRFSSDIQRTGYVIRENENEPPQEIKKRFQDIIDSISLGIDNIKVGMHGYEVDEIVRKYLISKGYPDYDHATGHAIGELTHNPGTNFTMSNSGTGALKVQPYGTYTIEPRIPVENGVSIEEMIVITENNEVKTLCERQMDIILIK